MEASLDLPRTKRLQKIALVLCAIGALASLAVGWLDPVQWLRSYLFAFMGCMELSLGCLALLMIHYLVGGRWGRAASMFLESGAAMLPWMALAFIPLAFGLSHIYPWADPHQVAASELLRHKVPYLNIPFFLARTAGCFAIWSFLVLILRKYSRQASDAEARGDTEALARAGLRLAAWSAPGLILYGITMHIAAFDWTMSLEPDWYSTMYGFLIISSQAPPVLALAILFHLWLGRDSLLSGVVSPTRLTDLGNLLLAFLLIWIYISFMQFLIIWSGNLPEETSWYLHRMAGGWQWLALALVAFQFAVPFFLLMFRRVKERPRILLAIALGLMYVHWAHMFWLIAPAFSPGKFRIHGLDLTLPLTLGGAWTALFARGLSTFRTTASSSETALHG